MRNVTMINPLSRTERESEIPSTPGSPEVLSGKRNQLFLDAYGIPGEPTGRRCATAVNLAGVYRAKGLSYLP